ncbi:bacteriophage protein [Chitinimonas prasina]|uniref:Bacteriophage protein n=1 Tax=Chitinimonas prasina TaxID=1434937 RepID=A0ABQ5YGX6_9NEIS|nr:baseplate J/gp47 family protein [Chitinimonas prasina]GLR13263.1 bacteriophage protein [Chitinimonas prasina]
MTTIALADLPPPELIEALDYETIHARKVARFKELYPAFTAALESEPVVKLLQLAAYDELNLRARINDAARAVLLPFARRSDLDALATLQGVARRVLVPANPDTYPPTDAVYESDDSLRQRAQMAPEGFTVAGSIGSYRFHALDSDPRVLDVAVDTPTPGQVRVTVLSSAGNGTPTGEMLQTVQAYLSADERRPLTDVVTTSAPTLQPYTVQATLHRKPGPEGDRAEAAARQALANYQADRRRLGCDVSLSGLYAALHQPGMVRVTIEQPTADVLCAPTELAHCQVVTLAIVVSNER